MITRSREEAYKHWLAALRGDSYRQTTRELRKTYKRFSWSKAIPDESFCCLGVLCDLAAQDGGTQWTELGYYDGRSSTLSERIRNFMGMTSAQVQRLMDLNDQFGASFPTIADHIEKNVMPKALLRGYK